MLFVKGITHLALLAMMLFLAQCELIERKPHLSKYQDAWKGLTLPGRFYLYMRSYEDEPFYGTNMKCVSSELLSVNEKERYTENMFRAVDPKDGNMINRTTYAWAYATEGYSTPNVIQTSGSLEKQFVVDYGVAFSEYDNCDILRLPHRNNACELWLKEGGIHNVKSLCLFVFDLLCGPEKYFVYDEDLCKKSLEAIKQADHCTTTKDTQPRTSECQTSTL
uniref:Putative lipocalin-7 1 n=1 Tax=Amblyomma triste TaxID=251400 RepID=A0A023G1U1_AMBTT